jgi:hypothetical protein
VIEGDAFTETKLADFSDIFRRVIVLVGCVGHHNDEIAIAHVFLAKVPIVAVKR